MYMILVCLQPDLCLIVGACGFKFPASLVVGHISRPNKLGLTDELESGINDGWLLRCAVHVIYKLDNELPQIPANR